MMNKMAMRRGTCDRALHLCHKLWLVGGEGSEGGDGAMSCSGAQVVSGEGLSGDACVGGGLVGPFGDACAGGDGTGWAVRGGGRIHDERGIF